MTIVQHRVRTATTEPVPPPGIPLGRITATELRKMLDTRSGFWTMASIALVSMATTGHGDPLRRPRGPHLPDVHRGDQRSDVADPADHRDPVGHRGVEPAQRPDDLHAGPAPLAGHRRQAGRLRRRRSGRHPGRLRDRRRRQRGRSGRRRSGPGVGPDDRQPAHDRAGQRSRHAGRLHARRARPQLGRRPSWRTSSTSSCCRPWP